VLDFRGDFDSFQRLYSRGDVLYGDYFAHLKDALQRKKHKNMVLLWYEDFTADLQKGLHDLAVNLGFPLSEDKLEILAERISFENFKKNDSINLGFVRREDLKLDFCRKGKVNDWENHLKGEEREKWRQWVTQKRSDWDMNDVDLKLPF